MHFIFHLWIFCLNIKFSIPTLHTAYCTLNQDNNTNLDSFFIFLIIHFDIFFRICRRRTETSCNAINLVSFQINKFQCKMALTCEPNSSHERSSQKSIRKEPTSKRWSLINKTTTTLIIEGNGKWFQEQVEITFNYFFDGNLKASLADWVYEKLSSMYIFKI